jgi:hypothetical protein
MNGIYPGLSAWTEAKHHLDQISAELNLEWGYAPESYTVVFRRANKIEHDLAVCFGSAEFHVTKEQVMWEVGRSCTQKLLKEWLGK